MHWLPVELHLGIPEIKTSNSLLLEWTTLQKGGKHFDSNFAFLENVSVLFNFDFVISDFQETLKLVSEAIEEASFLAIDGEFTGTVIHSVGQLIFSHV